MTDAAPAPQSAAKPERWIKRKQRIAELETENAKLRAALGSPPQDLDTFNALPQDIRDQMAARALFETYGDSVRALALLGFKVPSGRGAPPERARLIRLVLQTPGVNALLAHDLKDAEANRTAVVERMLQVTLHGKDDAAVRSALMVARLAGWTKDEPVSKHEHFHLFSLVEGVALPEGEKKIRSLEQGPAVESFDALDILGHDPTSATRIDSGDIIDQALDDADVHDEDPPSLTGDLE